MLRRFADATGRKLEQIAQPLRAALTGSTASLGIGANAGASAIGRGARGFWLEAR